MFTTQQNTNISQEDEMQTINEAVYASLDTFGSKTRFANYRRSNFYLLDVERHPESYCIKIAGATRNIYNVQISETERTIRCNCPDGSGYCRANNTICKHSYFILLKVLRMKKLAHPESNFFRTNILSEEEVGMIFSGINTVWANRGIYQGDFINTEFSARYNRHKEQENRALEEAAQTAQGAKGAEGTSELVGLDKFKTLEIKEGEEICSICYCEMDKPEDLVRCPTCNKNFHEDCIKRWFETGKSTCVMCRSPVWEEYQKLQGEYNDDIYYQTYTNLYDLMIA